MVVSSTTQDHSVRIVAPSDEDIQKPSTPSDEQETTPRIKPLLDSCVHSFRLKWLLCSASRFQEEKRRILRLCQELYIQGAN